ncbi:hypothetical protein APASM_4932 [Actinosynnema pretiosum subsp. pretiosum]|nr:hypothetical protein APASM_4932 [Actinosynnema pretiosum subsp. pretiosum]
MESDRVTAVLRVRVTRLRDRAGDVRAAPRLGAHCRGTP